MKKTHLYDEHKSLNAKFTEFNGWEMPVQYTSVIDEHIAVRTNVGLFDTAHMGTFIIAGQNAEKFLNIVTLGNMSEFPDKKARYSMILNENGGIKDDIIVYRFGNEYMIVGNAGNLEKDFNWLVDHKTDKVEVKNISSDICLIAVQGAKAAGVLQKLSETDITNMKCYTASELKLKNMKANFCRISRTGYTGEDGFEIFISKEQIVQLWEKLISFSVKPCGLGCRDTLRLEACMPLHGHEIDENINPIEAGFQKIINWENDFIGKTRLLDIKDNPRRKSIVFECMSGIARNSNEIFVGSKKVGYVTSGSFSPTLKKAIGIALVDADAKLDELEVAIHNQRRKINVVPKPFYKRSK
ncbi:MAG: glycine cleavage system aminomethyltransferase GcvT [Endomicrobium sp.]|jgi:glycine cleavage system T protein|nr:glycine cleavage system aminomethyltransferase GcvT [Endomicrobium sp.]